MHMRIIMFHRQIDQDTYLQYLEHHHAEELKETIEKNRDHLEQWVERFCHIKSLDEVKSYINICSGSFHSNKSLFPGIWYKKQLVGVAGLHFIDWKNKKTFIGTWLSKDAQGKGLANKGLREMFKYAFNDLQLNRLEAFAAVKNRKSIAMLLALDLRQEGYLRKSEILHGEPTDHYLFGLLKEDWK